MAQCGSKMAACDVKKRVYKKCPQGLSDNHTLQYRYVMILKNRFWNVAIGFHFKSLLLSSWGIPTDSGPFESTRGSGGGKRGVQVGIAQDSIPDKVKTVVPHLDWKIWLAVVFPKDGKAVFSCQLDILPDHVPFTLDRSCAWQTPPTGIFEHRHLPSDHSMTLFGTCTAPNTERKTNSLCVFSSLTWIEAALKMAWEIIIHIHQRFWTDYSG